eukprot:CAMPEP_0194273114 /NCGR_PEP_ID=MMETSP0169-20130528/6521_1 /TAXON_ID=218684 /ORGANISM="Corethron pennatum, Strain L29A3" /LENGTH=709 /DNA_ID=CAMNT_0039015969 /DNA_START=583 /DNA_END=2712 /DNA_ORIENTATION=+
MANDGSNEIIDMISAHTKRKGKTSMRFHTATWGYGPTVVESKEDSDGDRSDNRATKDDQKLLDDPCLVDASTMEDGSAMVITTHLREKSSPNDDEEDDDFPVGYYGYEPKILNITVGLVYGDEVIIVGTSKITVSGETARSPSSVINGDINTIGPEGKNSEIPIRVGDSISKNAVLKNIRILSVPWEPKEDQSSKKTVMGRVRAIPYFEKKKHPKVAETSVENILQMKTATFSFKSDPVPGRRFGFIVKSDHKINAFDKDALNNVLKACVNLRVQVNIPRRSLENRESVVSITDSLGPFRGPAECVAQSAVTAIGPAAVIPEGYTKRDNTFSKDELDEADILPSGLIQRKNSLDSSTIASQNDFTQLTFDKKFQTLGASQEESLFTLSLDENFDPEADRSFDDGDDESSYTEDDCSSVDSPYSENDSLGMVDDSVGSDLSDFLYGNKKLQSHTFSSDEGSDSSIGESGVVESVVCESAVTESISIHREVSRDDIDRDIDQGLDYLADVLGQFKGMIRRDKREDGLQKLSNETKRFLFFQRKKACFQMESEIKSRMAEAESVEVSLLREEKMVKPTKPPKAHVSTKPPKAHVSPKAKSKRPSFLKGISRRKAPSSFPSIAENNSTPTTPSRQNLESAPVTTNSPTDVINVHLEELRKLHSISSDASDEQLHEEVSDERKNSVQMMDLAPIFCARTDSSLSRLACGAGSTT